MIKRLKFRFITVNMSILTCVLVSVLVSIFILMYSSEVKLSYELMNSISNQKDMNFNNEISGESGIDYSDNNFLLLNNDFEDHFPGNEDDYYDYWDDPWNPQHPDDKNPPPPDDFDDDYDDVIIDNTKPAVTSPPPSSNESLPDKKTVTVAATTKIENNIDAKTSNRNVSTDKNNISSETDKKPENDTKRHTSSEKISKSSVTTSFTTVKTTSVSKNNFDRKVPDKPTPDPFKGKVKRTYIYLEFNDIDNLESIIYKYCDTENDEAVKKAAHKVFNAKKDRGKITIDGNKYRYLLTYDPPEKQYSIIFLDRTLEISTINRLLFIFIFIAGIGLIFIFFISVLLANWTIKPVSKAWDQQKQFIADASHELKTPLTVISTNTDVILSNPDDYVKNQTKWLNYIKNETLRMSNLVNNLLCIAKYDANKTIIKFNKFDISNITANICLQYEPLIFENNKKLLTDIDDDLTIIGDEDQIRQLINILMDNALKYSLNDGIIKISLKQIKQSNICLTVSNSSETIPQEQLDKIFDRFYRVDSSRNRKTGGSGLGLNIAKSIVEMHKGSINVVSKDNITSFIITFPI